MIPCYDRYPGHVFEDISMQYLTDLNRSGSLPFAFEKIGRQWGKIKGAQKKASTYEIDLVALNESSKDILFVECKWQELDTRSSDRVLQDLKRKAGYVHWNNEDRKEHFAIVAKRIKDKGRLVGEECLAFDLEDIFALI